MSNNNNRRKLSVWKNDFQVNNTPKVKFSHLYRGASYVPNSSENSNVPASGMFRISSLYGPRNNTQNNSSGGIYSFARHVFTNCTAIGSNGPTYSTLPPANNVTPSNERCVPFGCWPFQECMEWWDPRETPSRPYRSHRDSGTIPQPGTCPWDDPIHPMAPDMFFKTGLFFQWFEQSFPC